ncbi:GapS4a family protein [Aneurinibacillus aneurinilyticus]|uniref:GAPS4 PD-(D/E)XK nuclease domain-containing protein n=1 Tax=Aneurinibacillus aneurinilyticus ATCC 12856 TaxID=649747 RepID=U1XB95_ANEAE|nr:hypothetical protein [Aneurinibacillus aneurinilyticus]ERI11808.1 hypothetical protein HMPREF0083_00092 [Aneurinibacillus aneurinilyticus ATCC 12856]MED0709761.1 hypothetical protein [Aneurinibacillus aneurinilyticus]MED0726488.1 hypothetical protein [Aneurinibacillus aneurinilyticus]MED0735356.1 hypothetical protein [Aneurinibacillus aneurinilyticus]MED0743624.1 hypothetical protein [Aneurinibacillus aneurinilyticus]
MPGEKSKSSGEFGEKIVNKILKLIGWVDLRKGVDIDCCEGEKHKNGKNERKTHGIDYLFSYECPLCNNTQEDILISVKHTTNKYPAKPTNQFKEYLIDIAKTLECFPHDNEYGNQSINPSLYEARFNVSGVIFWLSNHQDDKDEGIIEKISDFRLGQEIEYGPVYLVDNKRANFLLKVINYVTSKYSENFRFVYPSTGYNNADILKKNSSGRILPVQYINSSILPIRIDEQDKGGTLLLFVNEEFDEWRLKRLIGLSHFLTEGWGDKKIILFPDYNDLEHSNIVSNVKQLFADGNFREKVMVKSFSLDLQTLGEE